MKYTFDNTPGLVEWLNDGVNENGFSLDYLGTIHYVLSGHTTTPELKAEVFELSVTAELDVQFLSVKQFTGETCVQDAIRLALDLDLKEVYA